MNIIQIITCGCEYHLEYRNILSQYFPEHKIIEYKDSETSGDTLTISVINNTFLMEYNSFKKVLFKREYRFDKNINFLFQTRRFLVLGLSEMTSSDLPWGILTGIRPVKVAHKLLKLGNSKHDVTKILKKDYLLWEENAQLITDLAQIEVNTMYPLNYKSAMLYIGIPFCPSRCNYCSFVSQLSTGNQEHLNKYFDSLMNEISYILNYVKSKEIRIQSIYVGGGTPTVLNLNQLHDLFLLLHKFIPFKELKEINFEAGRPETINKHNLQLLKDLGVTRLCINPQTLNDSTLINIGRKHLSKDYYNALDLARAAGFDLINTDMILGLEGETPEQMLESIDKVIDQRPENVTIHNLSLKRTSVLQQEHRFTYQNTGMIWQLNAKVRSILENNGYMPYYLYRQKYTQGNMENIGYCLPDKASYYNIGIMSEKISILGLGAGSSGKLFYPELDRLERMETVKNTDIYIQRLNQICEKKLNIMNKLWE